jgi:hypothetical protein
MLEITRQGFVTKQLQRTFEPGKTLVLTDSELSLSPVPPDVARMEDKAWKGLRGSRNPADLRAFVQRFPNGPHTQAANQLIQQIEWEGVDKSNVQALEAYIARHTGDAHSAEARQFVEQLSKSENSRREQTAWDSLDKRNKESLQDFLKKYPNSPHANSVQQTISELTKAEKQGAEQGQDDAVWRSVNRADRSSIDAYLSRFPSGLHVAQAREALAELGRQSTPPPSSTANPGAVLSVLQEFAGAWSAKDLSTIVRLQPSLTRRDVKARFENVRTWNMTLTPLAAPQINGDRASVVCRREIGQTFADGTKIATPSTTVTYFLRSQGTSWIIESFK